MIEQREREGYKYKTFQLEDTAKILFTIAVRHSKPSSWLKAASSLLLYYFQGGHFVFHSPFMVLGPNLMMNAGHRNS